VPPGTQVARPSATSSRGPNRHQATTIGIDPHKSSHTAVALDEAGRVAAPARAHGREDHISLRFLFVGANVARTALRAASYPGYWQARMREPLPAEGIRLVALGDSSVLAVGADDPMKGYVGRIARYITDKAGRPVHITNVSSGGTTADVVRDQLPQVDLAAADIVIVADSNDLENGVPLDDYRAILTTLVGALPADRTVFSDLALLPGRDPYQALLDQVTDARGIARADFAAIFSGEGRRLDIFSWLPPHLNSAGYQYWFRAFQPEVDQILARWPQR
jgi:lysophospholipase L1-like esterase